MKISSQVQALIDLPQHEVDRAFRDQDIVRELIAVLKQRNQTVGEKCANEIFRMLTKYSEGVKVTLNYPDATDLINEMAAIIDLRVNPPVPETVPVAKVAAPETKKGPKL